MNLMNCIQINGAGPYVVDNKFLVSGSSFIYESDMKSFYNIHPFDPNLEYLNDEIARVIYRQIENETGKLKFAFIKEPKKIAELNTLCFPLALIHSNNYFHFLIQSLTALAILKSAQLFTENFIIVTGILTKNMLSALRVITDDKCQIIQLANMNSVKCAQVILAKESYYGNELISGRPPTANFSSENIINMKNIFLEKYFVYKVNCSNNKIFIYRKSSWRNIINLDEIIGIAKEMNYTIVQPENLELHEQFQLFNSATIIAGPTGAWMANLIFASKNTVVKVLYPETLSDSKFWTDFCTILNLQLEDYFFELATEQNIYIQQFQPIHSNFYVHPDKFRKLLR
jgi:hypothetical protein